MLALHVYHQNAELFIEFSTKKLSISTILKKSIVLNGEQALAGLVLGQSWTVTIQKEFGLQSVGLSVFFFEKRLFLIIKNRTNQMKTQEW